MTILRHCELRRRLVTEARTWLKTPYHHQGRVKGERGGVDCAQILIAVFFGCGVIDEEPPVGNYAHDWHMNRGEELYEQWLDRYGTQITRDEVQPGDVALFRFGRTFSHGGIVVGTDPLEFIHSYITTGVTTSRIDESPLDGRPVKFWSIG